jgi:hypothetical protein
MSSAKPLPRIIRLEFSKAADFKRCSEILDPQVMKQYDPDGYVAGRLTETFRRAVNDGCVAMMSDEHGTVLAVSVNYQVHNDENAKPGAQHDYTELGSVLSRFPGYNAANPAACAAALKEWWQTPPKEAYVTEIKHSNIPPIKMYKALGWEPVDENGPKYEDLITAAYKTVPGPDGTGHAAPPPKDQRGDIGFYAHTDRSAVSEAKILLAVLNQGGLYNKRDNTTIPVDFSAMDGIGLTRPRLEALARGVTDKKAILAIK